MSTSDNAEDGRGTAGSAPVHVSAGAAQAQAPPVPAAAAATVFGDRLDLATRFTAILADTGVSHGLVGPREVPILWERHVLNCAVVHPAFPSGAEVVDVGSGAGLPGLALAVARPDLTIHLVEPMLRRTAWLQTTIDELGLASCTVHRGRAEEFHGRLAVPWATARAVARLDKLARWTFPLLTAGGTLVAIKGSRAQEELAADEPALRRLGLVSAAVRSYGEDVLEVPTMTVEAVVGPRAPRDGGSRRGRGRGRPSTSHRGR
jgi:16S rRNA (guanine527-N7)-methyltransferase